MAPKKKFLRLNSIVAYLQTERDGDEIFIKYNDKKVVPQEGKFIRMSKDPVPLEVEIELADSQQWVELELWDYDRFSPNDSLGKFKLLVDQVAEDFTAELRRDNESDGKYVLHWSVVERMDKKPRRAKTK
jgi:hypothetical protein